MNYFLFGNQRESINGFIKNIAKKTLGEVDDMNFIKYDAADTLVQDIVYEADSMSLGCDKKVVAVTNCYWMQKKKPRNKLESEQDYKALINYLKSPNEDCELILSIPVAEVDKNSELGKVIFSCCEIREASDPDPKTWKEHVQRQFQKAQNENPNLRIDRDALEELANRTEGDVSGFRNSLAKLILYTDHIRYEDVVLMVTRPLEDNSYQIFNYLITDKNTAAVKLYRDLKVANVEPVTLISMLAGQFRLLNQVVFLSKKGLSNDDIAKELGIKPVRVQILKRSTYAMTEKALHRTLDDLFNLDFQIKSGQVNDRYYAFELFLINFKRD